MAAVVAAWQAGAVVVPLLPGLPKAESARLMHDAGARLLIDPVAGASEEYTADDSGDLPDDIAILFFTSGTSGKPKGVPHTHAGLLANVEALQAEWAFSEDDRLMTCLPWNHVHGLWVSLLGALLGGFTIIQARRFPGAREFLEGVAQHRPTMIFGVPTFWSDLVAPGVPLPQEQLPLRLIVSGSAALPETVRARVRERFGIEPLERYGMTETGMILSQRLEQDRRNNPAMYPLPGVNVRTTEEGELEVRGPSVIGAYWRNPYATAQTIAGGWLRTGDLVEETGGGYRLIGRTTLDIIKCRGFKIAASEIEQAVLEHPEVIECCVVGLPDERLGEEIVAVLVIRDEAVIDEAKMLEHLEQRLSGSKVPQRFLRIGSIPRTPVGKIAKGELRDRLIKEGKALGNEL